MKQIKLIAVLLLSLLLVTQESRANDVNVTQATSTTTAVTANGDSGVITTFTETLATGTSLTFTVNNTAVDADSVVLTNIVNYAGAWITNGVPIVAVNNCVAGTSFDIKITNTGANALSGVMKIGFKLH